MTLPREYIPDLVWYELNISMCFQHVCCRAVKNVRKDLKDEGLHMQLPANHPLLQMHVSSLTLSHQKNSAVVRNYMGNVGRILFYVNKYLISLKTPPKHWSDLLGCGVEPFVDYLGK